MVMPGTNTGALVRQLGRLFPGTLGLLISPGDWKAPTPSLPYALDNGAYPAHANGYEWDAKEWINLLDKAACAQIKPRWVAVPDKVMDAGQTKKMWNEWHPFAGELGVPLAFVVQDGMTEKDVPDNADVVFVGGSTGWKWSSLHGWTARFPRVHVGRVNSLRRLLECEEAGAESCDGTGWFRGDIEQTREIVRYVTRNVSRQLTLFHPTEAKP